jgi:hypothetical protein
VTLTTQFDVFDILILKNINNHNHNDNNSKTIHIGTNRVCHAIKLSSLQKFGQIKGSSNEDSNSESDSSIPAYASKTLMHYLAHVSKTTSPRCLLLEEELNTLKDACQIDVSALDLVIKN